MDISIRLGMCIIATLPPLLARLPALDNVILQQYLKEVARFCKTIAKIKIFSYIPKTQTKHIFKTSMTMTL